MRASHNLKYYRILQNTTEYYNLKVANYLTILSISASSFTLETLQRKSEQWVDWYSYWGQRPHDLQFPLDSLNHIDKGILSTFIIREIPV